MPILKHRLELEGISHVISLVSFPDVKASGADPGGGGGGGHTVSPCPPFVRLIIYS